MSTPIPSSPDRQALTPQSLLEALPQWGNDLRGLMASFAVDAATVSQVMNSREFKDMMQLHMDLAIARAKIHAAQVLTGAVLVLDKLTECQNPETARRAAVTLMHISGLPTQPTKTPMPQAITTQKPNDSALFTRRDLRPSVLHAALCNLHATLGPSVATEPPEAFFCIAAEPHLPPIINQNPNDSASFGPASPGTPSTS